ncbi:MAG: acetyl-CoA decarbonylase/synthase complex subunit delta [Chloroflexi bacterium]|jgi:acetyl-CoA decarbonylase/synthase, CODH/ACS complex subunit delta|nr:acetyl-CoA decarbonylase/synthase complex subunit delta [Chloroflexota bacterium]MBT7081860.1 acetyl-CoA decarbonylase/synthase complex subunit delta [Chloroflexota bacterium]MBT7289455.1 acetyl-CoA decarbonylase/synthase complex subunit delta [Chloroflexota bacterium]
MPSVEIPLEKWTGQVHQVTLGAGGRKTVTVGGENTLPYLHFDGTIPNKTAVAIEIQDIAPADWSPTLLKAWGDVVNDPATWAKKAVEYGAEAILLNLKSAHPDEGNTGIAEAKAVTDKILSAVDVPLIVIGTGVADKDNEILPAVSEAARGQRIAIGNCEEKNYRTVVAVCIADGHIAIPSSPVDLNLAKQLNILLTDAGLPIDAILMDPTTGALGYGLEYTYSVMERLRMAGLGGDKLTAMPIINNVGEDAWKQKEAKVAQGLPESWGDMETRGIIWEEQTAISLMQAGSNLVVLRHPQSVAKVGAAITKLMG